jgi:uncharacterized protein YcfJ
MKTIIALSLTATLATLSGTALAQHHPRDNDDRHFDRARVLSVEPIIRFVRVAIPERECHPQEIHTPVYTQNNNGAAVVGGIVGAVLGHNLGHGDNGATVAGAIIGAAVGKNMTRGTGGYTEAVSYVDHCDEYTRYETQQTVEGYNVTYRYRGQVYTTRTDYEPGKFINVQVAVRPVGY